VTPAQRTDSISNRILSGVAWKAASQVTLQIARMVVALVLARLLSPHDWGLAAMVLVFSGIVVVFTDSALGTALIQRRDLREEDRSSVFWFTTGIGAVLAVGGMLLAAPLAAFYGEPDVRWLFVALSGGFLVSTLGATHSALLTRDMQFARLELRQITATVVGSVVAIAIALEGGGAWAIVGQVLGEAVVSTILLWILTPWRPRWLFSFASLRQLAGFAGYVFGENVLWQAGRSVVGVLIGRVLGAASLGAYTLATTVILMPFSRIAAPLQQVFFPAFSQMGTDRARMADVWIRATRLVAAVALPALAALAVLAGDFVDVVLGDRWAGVTPLIRILAVVGAVQSLQTLNGEILLALGRARTLFRFTALWFLAGVGSVSVGLAAGWGISGVAACYTVATLAVEPVRAYLTTSALGIPLARFVRSLGSVVQATAAMTAVLWTGSAVLAASGVPAPVRLVTLTVVGIVSFGGFCAWRAPEIVEELRRLRSARRRDDPPANGVAILAEAKAPPI
jgi:PST family polysaccharide transporter